MLEIRKLTSIHLYHLTPRPYWTFTTRPDDERIKSRLMCYIWLSCLSSVLQSDPVPRFPSLSGSGWLKRLWPDYIAGSPSVWVYLLYPHDLIWVMHLWQHYYGCECFTCCIIIDFDAQKFSSFGQLPSWLLSPWFFKHFLIFWHKIYRAHLVLSLLQPSNLPFLRHVCSF